MTTSSSARCPRTCDKIQTPLCIPFPVVLYSKPLIVTFVSVVQGPLALTTVRHFANSPENMSLNPSPHDLSLPWNALLGFGLEGPLYGETFDLFYLIGGVLRSR